jgi:2-dehydro-3-deoxyphosphogluconate aldolase/(4S)-4-hydroxy-2-oxoglutarate aldolase
MLKQVSARFGEDMLIGAGTVLDSETARAAILAGAEFIVTPTFNPATIEMCKRYGKPIVAGAMTPTEMLNAWQAGADLIKVFPVGNIGGVDYIKSCQRAESMQRMLHPISRRGRLSLLWVEIW